MVVVVDQLGAVVFPTSMLNAVLPLRTPQGPPEVPAPFDSHPISSAILPGRLGSRPMAFAPKAFPPPGRSCRGEAV